MGIFDFRFSIFDWEPAAGWLRWSSHGRDAAAHQDCHSEQSEESMPSEAASEKQKVEVSTNPMRR
jgi:hypothetical protein